jgi:predicted metalloprotease
MKNVFSVGRRLAVAAMIASAVAGSSSVAFAAPGDPVTEPSRPIRVTASDVEASNQKIGGAYAALAQMWTSNFKQIGEEFATPRIVRYTRSGYTACGVIRSNNAQYCPNNNTIYYDEIFVAGMAKIAASSVGTDGDMAAVGIIAHEMGHAVAMQLGHASRSSYQNESTADCLAGAFTKQADKDGQIEPGDIDEAFFGMSMAGDPTPEPTGNPRMDARIQARLVSQGHGTKEQRMQNFRDGLDGGAKACLDEFR